MRKAILILLMAASAAAASAQNPANSTATSTTAAKPATKTASAAKSKTTDSRATKPPAGPQLPPGVPPVPGPAQTAFSLQYQEIQIGTGAEAEPNKQYKVHYTGWLASDGKKFDSSYDHRPPVVDKDKKPVLDADGKPEMGDPQPLTFPQGYGRLIPGWDQGFYGMKIGGKRRLFIPWQLAYGAKGRPVTDPKAANYPGIPPKADLIFDVELLDVTEMPQPVARPGASAAPNSTGRPLGTVFGKSPQPGASAAPAQPGTGAAPSAAATPAAPAAAPTAATPAAPIKPAAPATPATPAPAAAPATPTTPAQPQSN